MLKARATELVLKQTFEGIRRVVRKEDIDKGGLYDSRSRAINIWCSSEDKSVGYRYKIRKKALNCPRDYIVTIMQKNKGPGNGKVQFELQVDPESGNAESLGQRVEPISEGMR